jgi:hypothetical protein
MGMLMLRRTCSKSTVHEADMNGIDLPVARAERSVARYDFDEARPGAAFSSAVNREAG